MKITTIISLIAGIFISTSVFADAAPGPCKNEDVKLATDYLQETINHFNDGIVAKVDVLLARNVLLDTQYCAGKIGLAAYCGGKTSVLAELLKIIQVIPGEDNNMRNGSKFNMIDYLAKNIEYRKICSEVQPQ